MSNGKILVIDDSEAVLARMKGVLESAGFEVVSTTQTVGAARYLRGIDLVIVDFHMPGLDGAAVLKSLRAAAAAAGTKPSIFLYSSDPTVGGSRHGFDGTFSHKGDYDALVPQVDAAFRLIRLRTRTPRGKPKG